MRSQSRQLLFAVGGDPVSLLRPLALAVVGLDEPVPLEALQRCVDLPDVQRPDLARSRLELVLQPQAVLRPLAEQSKEGVGDAHEAGSDISILSMYTRYRCPRAKELFACLPSLAAGWFVVGGTFPVVTGFCRGSSERRDPDLWHLPNVAVDRSGQSSLVPSLPAPSRIGSSS